MTHWFESCHRAVMTRGWDTVVSVGSVVTVGGFKSPQNKAGATIFFSSVDNGSDGHATVLTCPGDQWRIAYDLPSCRLVGKVTH